MARNKRCPRYVQNVAAVILVRRNFNSDAVIRNTVCDISAFYIHKTSISMKNGFFLYCNARRIKLDIFFRWNGHKTEMTAFNDWFQSAFYKLQPDYKFSLKRNIELEIAVKVLYLSISSFLFKWEKMRKIEKKAYGPNHLPFASKKCQFSFMMT